MQNVCIFIGNWCFLENIFVSNVLLEWHISMILFENG